jgi:D-beta-D-heptose 7-phosphate kinase / D-beta-D-heptose 1-phosphate adenosyltransferase
VPHRIHLASIVSRFPQAKIAVVGDLMADRFIYGSARRLSPEAPVPVVDVARQVLQPGGAANVANNVLSLGGALWLYGVLGQDEAGGSVLRALAGNGARLEGVLQLAERPTTLKTRVVAQAQHMLRFDQEDASPLPDSITAVLLERLEPQLGELSAVVLSDYAKGVLTPQLIANVIMACRAKGVPVIVDPKPVNAHLYTGADLIKPNLGEALRLVSHVQDATDADMPGVCASLQNRFGVPNIVVTAGGRGMFVRAGEEYEHLPGLPREVYDVAGAGDTTLAAIALALAAGAGVFDAARLGNLAGSIAVGRLGVTAVSAGELLAEAEAWEEQHG